MSFFLHIIAENMQSTAKNLGFLVRIALNMQKHRNIY